MEHLQGAEQLQSIAGIAPFFSDREASAKGRSRCIAPAACEHQRHSQGGLQMHFLEPTLSSIVQSENGPL
jgi:hypothetical protein